MVNLEPTDPTDETVDILPDSERTAALTANFVEYRKLHHATPIDPVIWQQIVHFMLLHQAFYSLTQRINAGTATLRHAIYLALINQIQDVTQGFVYLKIIELRGTRAADRYEAYLRSRLNDDWGGHYKKALEHFIKLRAKYGDNSILLWYTGITETTVKDRNRLDPRRLTRFYLLAARLALQYAALYAAIHDDVLPLLLELREAGPEKFKEKNMWLWDDLEELERDLEDESDDDLDDDSWEVEDDTEILPAHDSHDSWRSQFPPMDLSGETKEVQRKWMMVVDRIINWRLSFITYEQGRPVLMTHPRHTPDMGLITRISIISLNVPSELAKAYFESWVHSQIHRASLNMAYTGIHEPLVCPIDRRVFQLGYDKGLINFKIKHPGTQLILYQSQKDKVQHYKETTYGRRHLQIQDIILAYVVQKDEPTRDEHVGEADTVTPGATSTPDWSEANNRKLQKLLVASISTADHLENPEKKIADLASPELNTIHTVAQTAHIAAAARLEVVPFIDTYLACAFVYISGRPVMFSYGPSLGILNYSNYGQHPIALKFYFYLEYLRIVMRSAMVELPLPASIEMARLWVFERVWQAFQLEPEMAEILLTLSSPWALERSSFEKLVRRPATDQSGAETESAIGFRKRVVDRISQIPNVDNKTIWSKDDPFVVPASVFHRLRAIMPGVRNSQYDLLLPYHFSTSMREMTVYIDDKNEVHATGADGGDRFNFVSDLQARLKIDNSDDKAILWQTIFPPRIARNIIRPPTFSCRLHGCNAMFCNENDAIAHKCAIMKTKENPAPIPQVSGPPGSLDQSSHIEVVIPSRPIKGRKKLYQLFS